MTHFSEVWHYFRALAIEATSALPKASLGYIEANRRVVRPIDYMRCAEFAAVLDTLVLPQGGSVLDISSPQWFSIYLARRNPSVKFTYVNILESEIRPFREIARALQLTNLTYQVMDARNMDYASASFEVVISISVIEHIYPEVGGDEAALREIRRVLKTTGSVVLTLPYKSQRNIVYVSGPVYERTTNGERTFFAREYDEPSLLAAMESGGFGLNAITYICERVSPLAVDFREWGPGRRNTIMYMLIKSRKLLERFLRVSLELKCAEKFLSLEQSPRERLVNVCISLIPRN